MTMEPFSVVVYFAGNVRIRRRIDREEHTWVNFTAVASDRGQPALNTTIPVAIRILDINDNNPVFEESMYRVMVNESRSVGDVVTTVTATDPDEGEFGRVGYSMSGGSGVFTIDSNSVSYLKVSFYFIKVSVA